MKLESVRELQSRLLETLAPRPTAAVDPGFVQPMMMLMDTRTGADDFPRRPVVGARAAAAKQMALGVAQRKPGDYVLAVRMQEDTARAKALAGEIRERARGEVDERIIGRVRPQAAWRRRVFRPLRLGCSVGHTEVTAGTLGCFVKLRGDDRVMILSNNHVLANEDDARVGDPIVQPGVDDGGIETEHVVARLAEWVELDPRGRNVVDCAVAVLEPGMRLAGNRLTSAGQKIEGPVVDAHLDEKVIKLGRTTQRTEGRVTAINVRQLGVEYDVGVCRFDFQVEIEGAGSKPFSDAGDSGSLIVDERLRPVALLFAGSDKGGKNRKGLTYGNPLQRVFDVLEIDLL